MTCSPERVREEQEVLPLSRSMEAWERRDEAYGRMIAALQASDDDAYRAAMRDFWQLP